MEYFILTILWSLWCFLHSLLITPKITDYLNNTLQNNQKYFRIVYNIFALVSFIAVSKYASSLHGEIIFQWSSSLQIVPIIFLILVIFLFVSGTKNYNMKQFLGISQLSQKNSTQGIGEEGSFKQSGILKYTRHPWYVGILLFLWLGFDSLSYARLIMNSVFSIYLIIGTILEEKKMVAEFGDTYTSYQKQVPMFISLKSFTKK